MSYSASLPVTVLSPLELEFRLQCGVVLLDTLEVVEASESLLCEQDRDADCELDRKRCTVRDQGGDGGGECLVQYGAGECDCCLEPEWEQEVDWGCE